MSKTLGASQARFAFPQRFLRAFATRNVREIEDAPMILPDTSLIGEVVTETWMSESSLHTRMVSKLSMRSPRLIRSRICVNSSSLSTV